MHSITNYKIDPKVFVGGRWDTEKVTWHWTNLIEANGPFCDSLFFQIQKTFLSCINFTLTFPKRYTTKRLGTTYPDKKKIYLYCRSLKVFLHEICHFAECNHSQYFLDFLEEVLNLVDTIIPITKMEKMKIATQLVKHRIENYYHSDEDGAILEFCEKAAKANNLNSGELLDAYYN